MFPSASSCIISRTSGYLDPAKLRDKLQKLQRPTTLLLLRILNLTRYSYYFFIAVIFHPLLRRRCRYYCPEDRDARVLTSPSKQRRSIQRARATAEEQPPQQSLLPPSIPSTCAAYPPLSRRNHRRTDKDNRQFRLSSVESATLRAHVTCRLYHAGRPRLPNAIPSPVYSVSRVPLSLRYRR